MEMQDKRLVQLGGVAGILGFVFILVFFNAAPPVPGFCSDPIDQCLQAVAQNRTAESIGGFFGVGSALLLIPFTVMLYRSVRSDDSGYAQIGVVLGVLGFFVLALLVATSVTSGLSLAALYTEASPAGRGTIVTIASAVSGLSPGGLFGIDSILRATGLAALGVAMLKSPNFGVRYGRLTVLVGVLYIPLDFGGVLFDPLFIIANIMFFPWLAVLGWKLISLSSKAL